MVDSENVIMYMILACVVFLLVMIFYKSLKVLFKIILRGFIGLVGIYLFNIFTAPFGIVVGINVINALVIGILGIPGFICLYVMLFLL